MHRFASCLALIGALAVSLPAASGRADLKICNATNEQVFVMWVAPHADCVTRYRYNLALLDIGSCTWLESGMSSQGQTFYYNAWNHSGSRTWPGNDPMWIPNGNTNECLPPSPCVLSGGVGRACSGGRTYPMRSVYATTPDFTQLLK
jgi:hypothetical protein